MKINGSLAVMVIIAVVVLGIFGCTSKAPNGISVSENIANNPGVLYGKIVDMQTRKGIAGATVMLKVNGAWQSVGTAGASDGSITDTAGDFSFSFLPVNSTMAMVIKGPQGSSYITIGQSVTIIPGFNNVLVNNQVSLDLGLLAMEQGVTATVRVVDSTTGAFVSKTNGSAIAIYVNPIGLSTLDELATQDATDLNKYTVNIPQTGNTTLFVPAVDVDGDGKYDYASNSFVITTVNGVVTGQGNLTTTITLIPITNITPLSIAASNVVTYGTTVGGATQLSMLGKSDPINIFFNIPVTIPATGADAVTMTYIDDFKYLTAAAVTVEQAVAVTQGADNCLLTITPSAALIEGKTYTVAGVVSAKSSGNTVQTLALTGGVGSFDVKFAGATTLSAAGAITIDNFNYWTNGSVIGAGDPIVQSNQQAFLVFPEPVWGTVRYVSNTIGATTTVVNGAPVTITGQTSAAWYNQIASNDANIAFNTNAGANRAGFLFLFDLTGMGIGSVPDSTAAAPQIYTLGLDVYDAAGNTYAAKTAFPVQ